jgi:hypothetical protein
MRIPACAKGAALLCALGLLAPAAARGYGPDQLGNGDFHTTTADWTVSGAGALAWATADAEGLPHSGSARVVAAPGQHASVTSSPCVPLQPGDSYVVDGRALVEQAAPGDIIAVGYNYYFDAACTDLAAGSIDVAAVDAVGWKPHAAGAVGFTAGSIRALVYVQASASGNGVVAYFDRVQLRSGACTPSSTRLCLNQGRFEVRARWATLQGTTGQGQAVPFAADSGSFWFFAPTNLELDVKVLDGCAINDRFWVFIAGLTNVEVMIEVYDTETGAFRGYSNPQGKTFVTVTDTSAFSTCS